MQKSKMNNPKMFKILVFAILAVLISFCTNKNKAIQVETPQTENISFNRKLDFNNISFEIKLSGKKLTIQPTGLTADNSQVEHEIEGTIVNAEIGDLNNDNYPEILVYIVSNGSGSYGSVIGYSVNNGKSMSQLFMPEVAENEKTSIGYMGHDIFAIEENGFTQRFPIYKPGDINAKPTGGMRQVQYKLADSDDLRRLVVDKVVDY